MSLVVSQTLPYSSTELKLEDPKRWSRLFSLMRPSIRVIETPSGQPVVVDTAVANTKNTLIAAIGNAGNFSGKILSESKLAAFSTMPLEKQPVSAEGISKALKDSGFPVENGVVVIRAASKQDLRTFPGGLEVAVEEALKLDHILSLLAALNAETK
jgi:dihydroxyacetone kinase